MNFSIIYNPIATKFTQAALDHLIKRFKDKGYTLHKVKQSEYAGHVIPLIKELDPESDILVTFGGDGTVNEAVKAFNEIEQHSIYAHISAGTTNDMANNLELDTKDPMKSIDKLVDFGKETYMDTLIVNGEPACYVSTFGYVAPVPYLTNSKLKKKLGHAAYVIAALPILLAGPKRYNITYTANGETKTKDCALALISTSKGMGGITLYKDSDQNDGKFEVFLIGMVKAKAIFDIFLDYLKGSVNLADYIHLGDFFRTDKLDIKFNNGNPDYPVDNDGEKVGFEIADFNNELHYEIGKKIRILKPEK
ncbi:MAG: hypothetical protein IKJ88_04955 [Clostridia bacterium]|nr:hypothetical protein [Clostridia bacterium]